MKHIQLMSFMVTHSKTSVWLHTIWAYLYLRLPKICDGYSIHTLVQGSICVLL